MLSAFFSLCVCFHTRAQADHRQQVIDSIQAIAERYYSANHVTFDLTYRYALEESPLLYLDSLKGSFKMSGNRYWYRLDSTETIGDSALTVLLFKEDRVMYLTKTPKAARNQNPLAMMDSVYFNNPDLEFSISDLPLQRKITTSSRNGNHFKTIEYFINKQTGLLDKISSKINVAFLYDESLHAKIDKHSSYANVEVVFSNYQFSSFDLGLFNRENYCRKQGSQYVTVSPYQSYQIFLGSPNL